jgi:UDP-glucose 4-epimerase
MYETLMTSEESKNAIDMGDFYRLPADKRDLNYEKYFSQGVEQLNQYQEFNSNNTKRLTVSEIKEKLMSLKYIKEELSKWESNII